MTVSTNLNQFDQTPIRGMVAAVVNPTTISGQVDPNSVATLYAGDAVRLTDTIGETILVDAALAGGPVFAFIVYTQKKSSYTAGDAMELAPGSSVIYLEAGEAIARGHAVEWDATNKQIKSWAGSNPICGLALDHADGEGQLIRVAVRDADDEMISSSSSSCRSSSSSSSSRSSSSSSSSSSSRSSSSSSSSCRSSSSSSSSSSSA